MANPFSTSTTINNSSTQPTTSGFGRVPFITSPLQTLIIGPGEIGYDYVTETAYIGSLNNTPNIPIVSKQNSLINFLCHDVSETISNMAPSARAVRLELNKKADLTFSNRFTGMNEFPYLNILEAPPSQQDVVVTIRMLKGYIEGSSNVIKKMIIDEISATVLNGTNTNFIVRKYKFPNPSLTWLVTYSDNATSFSYEIMDLNGIVHDAPYTIIDKNNFTVDFNEATAGTLRVTYYAD
jgi:hypothetical protein